MEYDGTPPLVHMRPENGSADGGPFPCRRRGVFATAWLVPSPTKHHLLGQRYDGASPDSARSLAGLCATWTPRTGRVECRTSGVVGAATVLANGDIVIGNNAYSGGAVSSQASFRLRSANRESAIAGDAGSATLAMTTNRARTPRGH